jgi:hypothetical protein
MLVAVSCWRAKRDGGELGAPTNNDIDEVDAEDDTFSMAPDAEGFVLQTRSSSSLSAERIPLRGRLQTYVRDGSQYATWRQFPASIRYELEKPSGEKEMTLDLSMSISDDQETSERYSREPADQILGKDFSVNAFDKLGGIIGEAGKYRVRAHYEGFVSNWVDLDVGQ